jgi:hypothetical protein
VTSEITIHKSIHPIHDPGLTTVRVIPSLLQPWRVTTTTTTTTTETMATTMLAIRSTFTDGQR